MSCGGTGTVHVANNVARAKTGYLTRLDKGFFSAKWKQEYFVLYVDSTLAWFDNQGSYEPKGAILLKDVCQYLAVGAQTQYVPKGPPKLPPGSEILHLIAVPKTRSSRAEFVWILCSDQNELNEWLQKMSTVLPPPPQQPQQQSQGHGHQGGPPQPQPQPPPPGYPHQPPPYPTQPPAYPQQQGYPPQQGYPQQGYYGPPQYPVQQPPPQTVIIQQGGGQHRSRGGGSSDFATGMLLGGAMGYGMARPWGWGWGYGPGYGYGFGSFSSFGSFGGGSFGSGGFD